MMNLETWVSPNVYLEYGELNLGLWVCPTHSRFGMLTKYFILFVVVRLFLRARLVKYHIFVNYSIAKQ